MKNLKQYIQEKLIVNKDYNDESIPEVNNDFYEEFMKPAFVTFEQRNMWFTGEKPGTEILRDIHSGDVFRGFEKYKDDVNNAFRDRIPSYRKIYTYRVGAWRGKEIYNKIMSYLHDYADDMKFIVNADLDDSSYHIRIFECEDYILGIIGLDKISEVDVRYRPSFILKATKGKF